MIVFNYGCIAISFKFIKFLFFNDKIKYHDLKYIDMQPFGYRLR